MFTDVYVHFFEGGAIHAGVVLPNAAAYGRPEKLDGKPLQAYIHVSLNPSAPKAAGSLHKVIDDAFPSIKDPKEGQSYNAESDLGTLEFMYRLGYPATADAAKAALDAVMRLIASSPTVKFADKGQGPNRRPAAL